MFLICQPSSGYVIKAKHSKLTQIFREKKIDYEVIDLAFFKNHFIMSSLWSYRQQDSNSDCQERMFIMRLPTGHNIDFMRLA